MIRELLDRLPERGERSFVSASTSGLSQSEIGEIVGISQMHVSRFCGDHSTRSASGSRIRAPCGDHDEGGTASSASSRIDHSENSHRPTETATSIAPAARR